MTRTSNKGVVNLCNYVDDALPVEDKEAIKAPIEDINAILGIKRRTIE